MRFDDAGSCGAPWRFSGPFNGRVHAHRRLTGRGLPGRQSGDQYVVLNIFVPEAHSEEQRAVYREMARLMPVDPRADMRV